MVSRDRHPNKEIEEAIQYAIGKGWKVEQNRGHGGRIKCPYDHRDGCMISFASTPRCSKNEKRRLLRYIDRCSHVGIKNEK